MNASNILSTYTSKQQSTNAAIKSMCNSAKNHSPRQATSTIQFIANGQKSTGLKSIDQLILRYSINLSIAKDQLADNPFQKSLVLYGQDRRLNYLNLPPCMYMLIAAEKVETKFIVHRFYLPYKNGVRFAAYLLNEHGEIVESVSYQRNVKYVQAYKVIRKEIAMACNSRAALA